VGRPNGWLFCIFRTLNGYIAWSQSRDDGRSWTLPRKLRFFDGGPVVPQPIAPCALYPLEEGRTLLLFHNNDGRANGGTGPGDYLRNRTPAYLSVGHFVKGGRQPIRFEAPVEWMRSDGVPVGPLGRTEVATYTSLLHYQGRTVLWYPDRKHFLLGRYLTPADYTRR
jgi:hypothetical protein